MINHHYRRYDKGSLKDLIENSGLLVRDLRYFFMWPLGLMYLRKMMHSPKPRPGKSYTVAVPSAALNTIFAGLSPRNKGSCGSAFAGRLAADYWQ